MKKFIYKVLVTAFIVTIFSIFLFILTFFSGQFNSFDSYQMGYLYQLHALEASSTNKKIVVVGPSTVPFGIKLALLSEKTGYAAYELGVHAGMGMCLSFELLQEYVKDGDIVIIVFCPFERNDYGMPLIYHTFINEPARLWDFCKKHPDAIIKSFGAGCLKTWLRTSLRTIKDMIGSRDSSPNSYSASCFNATTGEYTFPRPDVQEFDYKKYKVVLNKDQITDECLVLLNQVIGEIEAKGAKVLVTFQPILRQAVDATDADISEYETKIINMLNASIISTCRGMFFEYDEMYNGVKHLNDKGAENYTQKIIRDMSKYLNH